MAGQDAGCSGCLTILCLLQDVQDVCQFQCQLIGLLGHVWVHTLDLGTVCRRGGEWLRCVLITSSTLLHLHASRTNRQWCSARSNADSSRWLSPVENRTWDPPHSSKGGSF